MVEQQYPGRDMRARRPKGLVAACAAACALTLVTGTAVPSTANAAPDMLSVMQDDNLLVYGSGTQRDAALDAMKALGVDAIRATVLWQAIAPDRKPRRNPASPRAYHHDKWNRYDDLVKAATKRGIRVYFSVTGPGPKWAHAKTRSKANQRTWKPSAKEFGRFMRALGTRYSGKYKDEDGDKKALPRVDWWGIFNEPNQGGWLTPQTQKVGGRRTPMSPVVYRDLLYEGAKALWATGHRNDIVLIGETAPLGRDPKDERSPLRPALFIRELFCLDKRLRRYRGKAAKVRNCSRVGRLSILRKFKNAGYGHHPYTKELPPDRRDKHRDAITMANLKDLESLLDKVAAKTRVIKKGMPVYLTEFGYETNPPDPFNGIPIEKHAAWLNLGDYLAYRAKRVKSNTQFQLVDVPPRFEFKPSSRQYWFTYQSGLFTWDEGGNFTAKPAAAAYQLPLVARDAGNGKYLFWGQARVAPRGKPTQVYLQLKDGFGNWTTQSTIPVNGPKDKHKMGFWSLKGIALPGQVWRAVWVSADGSRTVVSREVTLD